MNDLLNNNTKIENIKQLYYEILKIVELYEKFVPKNVRTRKNKGNAKMTDAK